MSKEKHEAFVAALRELFQQYPLKDYRYKKYAEKAEENRLYALGHASAGAPLYLVVLYADQVPADQIKTVHALIYG